MQTKKLVMNIQETLNDTVNSHSVKIAKLYEDIAELQSVVADLQHYNVFQEQESLRNHMEIIGIPEHEKESLPHLVKTSCSKIGIDLKDEDIDDVFRAGAKQPKGSTVPPQKTFSRPVVIRLVRRQKRDEILAAAKSRRNVTTEGIIDGQPKSLYFNERLSKYSAQMNRLHRSN